MKKFWKNNKEPIIFCLKVFYIWRAVLLIPQVIAELIPFIVPYLGYSPWANFDGEHYINIAKNGYMQYEQAFFPLYPVFIRYLSKFLNYDYLLAAYIITYFSLFVGLVFFYKLLLLYMPKDKVKWAIVLFLFFPTSFFLAGAYTESLFLAFVFSSIYFSKKNNFWLAALLAGFASATRIVGIFLIFVLLIDWTVSRRNEKKSFLNLIPIFLFSPIGLFSYFYYLWVNYGDPLLFVHTQSAFGANRSGGEIILLPQVIYRYIKIFITVPIVSHTFLISFLEFTFFSAFLALLIIYFKKINFSFFIFSIVVILFPTLSGTLLSEPRFVLVAFPVFAILATVLNNRMKKIYLVFSCLLLIILSIFFLRGYFVA